MEFCRRTRKLALVSLVVALWTAGPAAGAEGDALELLVGRWDARVKTLRPQPAELTYTEVYEWVLDNRFLRGRTEKKSDGTEDVVFATYDAQAKGYPFWVFSSTGTYTYLAPATWDARTRTMVFTNPPGLDISYRTVVIFPGDGTRHWTVLVKDWKGSVLLEQEGRAVRRSD